MKKMPKNATEFYCKDCDFKCSKYSNFEQHLSTAKHKNRTNRTEKMPKNAEKCFTCECGKVYKARNSLWYHKKKCDFVEESEENIEKSATLTEKKIDANMVRDLIKQNRDLQDQLITMANNKSDNITINNTQNNKFNINLFLNEQCSNAINFTDFIERIEVSHKDLEKNAELGFVNGISKILMDNLKQLTLYERPIHCTDVKRETMYIKDHDQWQKDEGEKITNAIQEVSRKSIRSLMDWKNDNPDYDGAESEFSNKCVAIQQQSLAGDKKELYYQKVIHNLAKESSLTKITSDNNNN